MVAIDKLVIAVHHAFQNDQLNMGAVTDLLSAVYLIVISECCQIAASIVVHVALG